MNGKSVNSGYFSWWWSRLQALWRWQHLGLVLLILLTLGLHFATIMQPEDYLFDEAYYVPDARSIIAHEGSLIPEHPPLGKLLIIEGIRIFGDNPLGWRFFSVIFGTLSIILLYFLCRRLKMPQPAVLLTTFLFSLENLSFIQSSVAMLDVYCLTFMLAAGLYYLRENFLAAGLLAGLSMLSKLTGLAILAVFVLYWLFTDRKRWQPLIIPIVTAVAAFLVLMPLLEFTFSSQWDTPFQRVDYMLNHAGKITMEGLSDFILSRPWEWLMNRGLIFYSYDPQYLAVMSFTISIMVIPAVLWVLYKGIKQNQAALWSLTWIICNYLPWIPISLIFNRTEYIYYMYPVIIAICIGIGLVLTGLMEYYRKNRQDKLAKAGAIIVWGYLILHVGIFVVLSPLIPSLATWIPL